jgi:hypothetical protein
LLKWYCDLVEHRAKRDGVKFFIFDPFNEHDSTRAHNQTETEYVREMMLCQTIPPPPPGVPPLPATAPPGSTVRQILTTHRSAAQCAACHALGPIGSPIRPPRHLHPPHRGSEEQSTWAPIMVPTSTRTEMKR